MNPNRYRRHLATLCFSLLSLGVFAQADSLQTTTEKGIDQWKDGFIVLSNGKQYFGEIRCFVESGSLSEHVEFRKNAADFSQIFLADTCDAVQWGEFKLLSLPKNFRKRYDKMFYMTMFMGNNIRVFFEPKFTKKSKPESVRFLILKEGVYTSVTKSKFKRTMNELLGDSAIWREKTNENQWFAYSNMFEVAKFYDNNMVLVSTDFED